MKLILDLGSGNSCNNDKKIVDKMLSSISWIDRHKHQIIIKWQLFKSAPPNIPLDPYIFDYAYLTALEMGYRTTASVFDEESLKLLSTYKTPFIKIACRDELYKLSRQIKTPVYISVDRGEKIRKRGVYLCCVPKYPATIREYESEFNTNQLSEAISDHTIGWDLMNKYKPNILEKHFVHERNKNNPDAGVFAVTADELKEIM